jgi:hypothetical protein
MSRAERFYSRGKLPHWDEPGACQFLTWRLAGSVPEDVQSELQLAARSGAESRRRYWQLLEEALDLGHGTCLLSRPQAGAAAVESFLALHGTLVTVHAFVVMPNHCHLLLTIDPGFQIGELVRRLKGSSARAVNRASGRTGQVWQEDYFDRVVRDDDHFVRTLKYIEWNPVKAGLCSVPGHYSASSANPRWAVRLNAGVAGRTEVRPTEAD